VIEARQTVVDGRTAARTLLSKHRDMTAICCTTDTLAVGALCECRALGVGVPEQVSVIGCSDLEIVSQLDRALTTVHIPADRIGTAIADFLLDRINGKTGPQKIELEASLVIRDSAGPVRRVAPRRLDSSFGVA
jgi:LacI family transcriptional regulator